MKKIHFIFIFLLTAIVTGSCVSSLYPISDNENDFLFREELIGRWADNKMETQLIIQKAANKKYNIAVIDIKNNKDGKKGSVSDSSYFSGFLIQLGNQYFFDCTPDTDHPQFSCLGEETKSALLPLHSIYKVHNISKDQWSISGMDIDSMQKFIHKDKYSVKHEKPGKDHILLTADAAGLQKIILTNKEAALIFNEPTLFTRIK